MVSCWPIPDFPCPLLIFPAETVKVQADQKQAMRGVCKALLVCLLPALVAARAVQVTDHTFQERLQQGSMFVLFHMPWCGHCKVSRPQPSPWHASQILMEAFTTPDSPRVNRLMPPPGNAAHMGYTRLGPARRDDGGFRRLGTEHTGCSPLPEQGKRRDSESSTVSMHERENLQTH